MDFRTEYPEFMNVGDEVIDAFLKSSAIIVNRKAWGNMYELGLNAYTAHRLAVKGFLNIGDDGKPAFNNGQHFKAITSQSAGSLSMGFSSQNTATGKASDYDLSSTSYGQEYLRLRALITPFGVVRRH